MRPAPESPAVIELESRRTNRRQRRQLRARGSMMRQITRNAPLGASITEFSVSDNERYGGRAPGLVAAAQTLWAPGTPGLKKKVRMPRQEWQKEVWALRRETPELRFSGDRTARAVSRVRLFIGKRDLSGESSAEPSPLEPGDPLIGYDRSMFGDPGATAQAMRRCAQQIVNTGDSLLLISDGGTGDGNPQDGNDAPGHTWATYSTSEITGLDGKSRPTLNDGMTTRKLTDSDMVVRCWVPDPEYTAWADAPTRAIIPIARELVGLTKYVSAQIDSRLAGAGLLIVPAGIKPMGNQIQVTRETPIVDEELLDTDLDDLDDILDAAEAEEPMSFSDQLGESMIIPVENRDSAASLVPFIAECEPDLIAKIQYIRFDSALDQNTQKLRDEAIRRIALGMDSAPSVLLGLGGSNHWAAWAVNEDEQKLVVEPLVGVICHALTSNWLRLVCLELGLDPLEYTVFYDATALKLRPDRSKDAQILYDSLELSGDANRRESGFDPHDKPSDEEYRRRFIEKLVLSNPQLAGALLPDLGIMVSPEQQALIESATGTDGSASGDILGGDKPTAEPPQTAEDAGETGSPDTTGAPSTFDKEPPASDTTPGGPSA